MAKHTVKVDLNLVENFKIEGKAGNHTVYIDQPKNVKGTDTGPNPSEYFLLSLGGCIITIAKMAARQKRIKMNDFKLQVEGTFDLDGLMGKDPTKRSGFENITLKVDMDADISDEEKRAFIEEVEKRCPVSDNITNPSPIKLELA
ncbi:MAG: OsmC family protein [Candidatus Rifleibacteriota bacterium]